jgi:co-chaperonin GroES (HSP10)
MKILGNKVLIEPTAPIDQLPSGLWLPQTAVEKPNTGTVVVIGEGANASLQGRTVLYNPITAIEIDGKHLLHVLDVKFVLS